MTDKKHAVTASNEKLARALGYGVAGAAVLATSQVHALDVDSVTSTSTANTDIESGGLWVLGIVVLIFAAKRVIGFFGR